MLRPFEPLTTFPFLLRPLGGELHGMGFGAYCLVRRDIDWTDNSSREANRRGVVAPTPTGYGSGEPLTRIQGKTKLTPWKKSTDVMPM